MKIKLFTHTDLDGVGCAIVAKYEFNNIDISYCNYDDIDSEVSKFIALESYKYDKVFITDISVSEPVAEEIDEYIGDKTYLLDHHATAEWLNKYKWANVNPIHEDGNKSSGTTMLFNYLNQPLELLEFVEKVRRYDTWEWSTKYNDLHAKQLNDLLYIIGREKFIERFLDNLSITLTENEQLILDLEQERIDKYIERKQKEIVTTEILGYKAGIVFAELYVSQLGNELAKLNPDIDFIAMVNMGDKKVSYRTIRDDIDLGKDVAKIFGGGGHPKASGSEFGEEIKNKVIKLVFNNN